MKIPFDRSKRTLFALATLMALSPLVSQAHSPVAESMAQAAQAFLDSLTENQKAIATFELTDEERKNWHFIPKERKGLPWTQMDKTQRLMAHAFLSTGLSTEGYAKSVTIMSLEQVLYELENQAPHRNSELYHVSVFGKPDAHGTWGWRVEGHHLSVNFTIVEGHHIAGTPSFFGANPAHVQQGPHKGLRVLAAEEDLARHLVKSLNPELQEKAIINKTAPRDIITGADRHVSPLKQEGVAYSELNDSQQHQLMAIVHEYLGRNRPELAALDLAKIREAGLQNIYFAWAGALEPGQGHYYRVQGPTFLLEYDNTQNNANHIHAVWRDFKNDYGEDLLRKHYEEHNHN